MKKDVIYAVLAFVACLAALGYVGESDRVDYIISTMSSDTYHEIVNQLSSNGNGSPSDREIVEYYSIHYDNAGN